MVMGKVNLAVEKRLGERQKKKKIIYLKTLSMKQTER
jgi:hypothetical protein